LDWDFPSKITNAIIDFGILNLPYVQNINYQLENLGCRFIQLRFFDKIDSNQLDQVISNFDDSIIESIDISLRFTNDLFNNLETYLEKYSRINCIIIYDYPYHTSYNAINKRGRGKLFTHSGKVSEMSCGIIETHNFNTNIKLFTESQHHNTCLNRKISIDKDGYIKNCPSMKHNFGHIGETKLEEVIKNPEFTKYWNIKKDQIKVCQDCEFRHICTDCRAYIEDPTDLNSKPLKCGYNPYTCEWEEWSTNPLKHKAMEYYGFPVN
jgi:SPASM domain peptide maturase of grasp-with-spasm system